MEPAVTSLRPRGWLKTAGSIFGALSELVQGPHRQAPQAVTLITPPVYLSGFRQDGHLLPPGSQPGGFLLDQCSSRPRWILSSEFSASKWAPPFPNQMHGLAALPHPDATAHTLALPWPFPPNSGLKKLQLQSSLQNIANCCALPVTWSYLLKEAKTKPISNIALQLLKSFASSSNSQGSRD